MANRRGLLGLVLLRSSELPGKEVIGDEGWRIGIVKGLEVDTATWQVKALTVELLPNVAEEFEMKRLFKRTRVPIGVENVKNVGDHVVLKVSKAQLKDVLHPSGTGETSQVKTPPSP